MKVVLRQFVKWAMVGGFGAGINLTVTSLLFPALSVLFANAVGIAVAACSNFTLHKLWVFRVSKGASE